MNVHLKRINQAFHYEVENATGNLISLDGNPAIGGENKGFRPMELMLAGIAGCSSIDVGLILSKQKQVLEGLEVKVEAEREKDKTPALFTDIHVHFILKGNLDPNKAKRAVELSMDKYCSVAKILEKTANITYSFEITPGTH